MIDFGITIGAVIACITVYEKALVPAVKAVSEMSRIADKALRRRRANELLDCLNIIKFNEIETTLDTIVREGKITDSSVEGIKKWYNTTANELDGAKEKLGQQYMETHGNVNRYPFENFGVIKDLNSQKDIFRDIYHTKDNLKKQLDDYIRNNIKKRGVEELDSKDIEDIKLIITKMKEMNDGMEPLYKRLREIANN